MALETCGFEERSVSGARLRAGRTEEAHPLLLLQFQEQRRTMHPVIEVTATHYADEL